MCDRHLERGQQLCERHLKARGRRRDERCAAARRGARRDRRRSRHGCRAVPAAAALAAIARGGGLLLCRRHRHRLVGRVREQAAQLGQERAAALCEMRAYDWLAALRSQPIRRREPTARREAVPRGGAEHACDERQVVQSARAHRPPLRDRRARRDAWRRASVRAQMNQQIPIQAHTAKSSRRPDPRQPKRCDARTVGGWSSCARACRSAMSRAPSAYEAAALRPLCVLRCGGESGETRKTRSQGERAQRASV